MDDDLMVLGRLLARILTVGDGDDTYGGYRNWWSNHRGLGLTIDLSVDLTPDEYESIERVVAART